MKINELLKHCSRHCNLVKNILAPHHYLFYCNTFTINELFIETEIYAAILLLLSETTKGKTIALIIENLQVVHKIFKVCYIMRLLTHSHARKINYRFKANIETV